MGKCYIIAANLLGGIDVEKRDDDLLIAADGGYKSVLEIGVEPDIILGDFDSLGFVPKGKNVICLPVKKDDTDTLAAVRVGFDRGFKDFYIYGGLGGRTDHTIANIQTLGFIAENGGRGYLIGDNEVLTVIKDSSLRFKNMAVGTVSVFAYGNKSCGVMVKGLAYELDDAELKNSFPIGVSNTFVGKEAVITVKSGSVLVVFPKIGYLNKV